VLFLFILPLSCWAGLIPVLDITGGGTTEVPLADAVGGWQLDVSSPITISALGVWDEGGAPLNISHEVGLWTLSQTLLATAVVDNASTVVPSASLLGNWLFTDITPITLDPGDYVLGAVWGDPIIGADPFRVNATVTTSFGTTCAGSSVATLLPGPILVFPGSGSLTGGGGIFGPNLAVAVPEPNAAGLLLFGIVCLSLRRFGQNLSSRCPIFSFWVRR